MLKKTLITEKFYHSIDMNKVTYSPTNLPDYVGYNIAILVICITHQHRNHLFLLSKNFKEMYKDKHVLVNFWIIFLFTVTVT